VTDDEKRQQKGMLMLDYLEAEQHLGSLQEKARRTVESLKVAIEWLEKTYDQTWNFEVTKMIYIRGKNGKIDDPAIQSAMNYDQMIELGKQVQAAMDNLRNLKQRKESLGLK
jgi:hypothetical protein